MNFRLYILFASLFVFASCGDNLLTETPKDFLSPESAFTDVAGIEQGITGIYADVRDKWYRNGGAQSYGLFGLGTDASYDGENPGGQRFMTNYQTSVTPEYPIIEQWWRFLYAHIQQANIVLEGIDDLDPDLWNSDAQKNAYIAEARFFRAFAHRLAVTLWGDVPLILDVVNTAKIDFERTSKDQVYNEIVNDLVFASEHLPVRGSEPAPGRLTQGAALHLLTQVYLAMEEYELARDAATDVINDYGYELMTQRFGDQIDPFGSGDVYWDLFRYDNQNTTENTETIWAIQFEEDVEGGSSNYWSGIFGPRYFSWGQTPDGMASFSNTFSDTLGRPVARNRGTDLVNYHIWEGDWDNDIRNAPHNIKRDFYFENPNSAYHGQKISPDLYSAGSRDLRKDTTNYIFPFFMKTFEPVVNVQDHGGNPAQGGGGEVRTNFYAMRLAETYLLRAEAWLGLDDPGQAANDINVVRNRANATPVAPGDVDLDYILDERLRELYAEEMRLITLMRTDKLVERTQQYHDNPFLPGAGIESYNELFPIPQSQIDLNLDAQFQQNPGYGN